MPMIGGTYVPGPNDHHITKAGSLESGLGKDEPTPESLKKMTSGAARMQKMKEELESLGIKMTAREEQLEDREKELAEQETALEKKSRELAEREERLAKLELGSGEE